MDDRFGLRVARWAFGVGRFTLLPIGLFCSLRSIAQEKPEMADVMRSNGKIYVVVVVCLIILVGLFVYMMLLDRKMNKMEKNKHGE